MPDKVSNNWMKSTQNALRALLSADYAIEKYLSETWPTPTNLADLEQARKAKTEIRNAITGIRRAVHNVLPE